MLSSVRRALTFLTPLQRIRFYVLIASRALVSVFDLAGILAIGFLATSIALFLTEGSDPGRTIEMGPLSISAISAQTLPVTSIAILALFVGKALLSILLTHQLAHFLARIESFSAKRIAESAFGKGVEASRKHSRDEILFATQSGSPSAFGGLLNSVGTFFAEGFLFILVLSSFLAVDLLAAVGAILYFGMIGLLIQYFIGKRLEATSAKIAQNSVVSTRSLLDLSEVARETAILGKQGFFTEKLFQSRLASSGASANQMILTGLPRHIVETALLVGISIFVLSQSMTEDFANSAATIGIFLAGGLRLTAALLPLQSAILTIKQSVLAANLALDFLDSPLPRECEPPSEGTMPASSKPLGVKVAGLHFHYSESKFEVLKEVNFEITPGSQVAFIGPSGSGKSTLADIVLGLLEPSRGSVQLDGRPPKNLISVQPGILGYVPQQPGMVTGTIRDNIALGVEPSEVDQKRLLSAISDAHLEDLIESLDQGVYTDLGKRKDQLSGGQLQRIGLARALYTKPSLLVLDEATSALDAESESQINAALNEMRGRVTVILIAHRLNTVQHSDEVFLLEDGRVSDSGTFQQLAARNSRVNKLASLMSIGPDKDAV